MMDRLETAFASQREFVNDAGHEPAILILKNGVFETLT
jgi:hypothetical protein